VRKETSKYFLNVCTHYKIKDLVGITTKYSFSPYIVSSWALLHFKIFILRKYYKDLFSVFLFSEHAGSHFTISSGSPE